jgi:hypothetical protein
MKTFTSFSTLGGNPIGAPSWVTPGSTVDLWMKHSLYWALGRRYAVASVPGLDAYAFENFEATSIKGLATVTRAGVGTVVQDGSVASVAAGMPRVGDTGILVEEARTNLLLNSATLSTQSVTTAATAYTLSFKGTGTVTLSGTSTAGPLVGTGASDIVSLTFTPTVGTLTCTVSGTVEEANLEAGAFATTYIPTAGASVTRAADDVTISTSLFDFSATAGTVFVEFVKDNVATGAYDRIISLDDGTAANHLEIYNSSGSGATYFDVKVGGVTQASPNAGTVAAGAISKIAAAWTSNDFAVSLNGANSVLDTTGTVPTGISAMVLGAAYNGTVLMGGSIRKVYYYASRLTNAQIEGMTAGTIDPATLSPVLSLDFINRTYSRGGDPFAETVLSDDFTGYGSTAEMQTVWPDVSGGLGTLSSAALLITLDTADTLGGNEATIETIVGQAYEISAEVVAVTGTGTGKFTVGSTTGAVDLYESATTLTAAVYTATFIATTTETFVGLYAVGVATDTVKWDNITIKRVELYLTGIDTTLGLSATESFDLVYDDATTATQAAVGGELTLVATNNPLARVSA